MRLTSKLAVTAGLLALAMVPRSNAQALNSNTANVNLNAVLAETLTVSATPGTVNFNLVPSGPVSGTTPVSITTQWALASTRTKLAVWAYFSTTTALTNGAGNNIPNTSVSGNPDSTGLQPFSATNPFNGLATGVQIYNTAITAANVNSTHSDSLNLQIDTTGLNLPAGTYTGVLNIEAQAL
ncbi:MAG TPA: hypothetical protein VN788_15820 [Verrucomicrobiae bacterium]|nr:hypothetical protein [Verrucomicrobiae bacterium]HXU48146.1 hypothetical protein [Candidatus Binatia bacterium]